MQIPKIFKQTVASKSKYSGHNKAKFLRTTKKQRETTEKQHKFRQKTVEIKLIFSKNSKRTPRLLSKDFPRRKTQNFKKLSRKKTPIFSENCKKHAIFVKGFSSDNVEKCNFRQMFARKMQNS